MRKTTYVLSSVVIALFISSPAFAQWAMTYGGNNYEHGGIIHHTRDGGYIVAGATNSFDQSNIDIWILKLHSDGSIAWQKTYGLPGDEMLSSIQQTQDGGYIVPGYTSLLA